MSTDLLNITSEFQLERYLVEADVFPTLQGIGLRDLSGTSKWWYTQLTVRPFRGGLFLFYR